MMNHMTDDSEFLSRLINFGLSEKEAQLYFYLLKYGPKTSSMLAKPLKTYREDVYRTLTNLVDMDMVEPSLESPTVYTAVDLDVALDVVLKKRESELREMERQKQELQEILKQQQFRPADEIIKVKVCRTVKEYIAHLISDLSALEKKFLFVMPGQLLFVAARFGVNEAVKKFIERGGCMRGICDVTYPLIELVQELLDIGVDMRHFSQYRGIYFLVYDTLRVECRCYNGDRKYCVNMINTDIKRMSLDERLSGFCTDDATYVNSLISTFELLWEQAVPAAQRIEELLKEGSPDI